jgi:hypothetical protein
MLKATGALAGTAAVAVGLFFAVTNGRAEELYPQIADTSHAAAETAEFFSAYFTAKSRHDPAKTMAHFSPDLITYTDATLGWDIGGFEGRKEDL